MDIKEYISSGILESYVLGSATEDERKEVECMSHIYPEIKDELTSLQQAIEKYAGAIAKNPSDEVKQKILATIKNTPQEKSEGLKVVHSNAGKKETTSNYAKYAIAASVVALFTFAGLYFNSSSTIKDFETQLSSVIDTNTTLESKNTSLLEELNEMKSKMEKSEYAAFILAHSDTKKVPMPGVGGNESANVRVYWNTTTKGVFLKVDELPKHDEDKQYQLWAIVDGKPTDMGVFDLDKSNEEVQQMPYEVDAAQAFAITLENKGGSEVPNLDALVVIGNV